MRRTPPPYLWLFWCSMQDRGNWKIGCFSPFHRSIKGENANICTLPSLPSSSLSPSLPPQVFLPPSQIRSSTNARWHNPPNRVVIRHFSQRGCKRKFRPRLEHKDEFQAYKRGSHHIFKCVEYAGRISDRNSKWALNQNFSFQACTLACRMNEFEVINAQPPALLNLRQERNLPLKYRWISLCYFRLHCIGLVEQEASLFPPPPPLFSSKRPSSSSCTFLEPLSKSHTEEKAASPVPFATRIYMGRLREGSICLALRYSMVLL